MKKIKVAINGFGRIGRLTFRRLLEKENVEIVAINDLTDNATLVHLLKYDSVHGRFNGTVTSDADSITVNGHVIKAFAERDPKQLPWGSLGIDVVLESTGRFIDQDGAGQHLTAGARKVIISAPAKGDIPTVVLGVNDDTLTDDMTIISNASCTTNCLGPIAKIIDDAFGIEKGLMTTIHSYTNDQNILDVKHKSDKRRARAGAQNMIPTSTGAAKAMKLIMPQLEGKLHGQSVRVPTPNVSMVDVNFVIKKDTTKEEINALFTQKSKDLAGIVAVDNDMLVSSDIVGNTNSTIIASDLTQVIGGNMIKIMSWYDNEWGYSARLVDLAVYVAKK